MKCAKEECSNPSKMRGMCVSHYNKWIREYYRNGGKKLSKDYPDTCTVPGCNRPHCSKGYCQAHWVRNHNYGDVKKGIPITKSHPGSDNNNWKGGTITDGHGRVLIYSPNHPNPSYCGTHVYRYRLVMEARLGRYLLPIEIVHHKNGDVSDDRIENLEVMTQSEHAKLHWVLKLNGRWSLKHDKCVLCGTTKFKHEGKGKCRRCYSQQFEKTRKRIRL